MKTKKDLLLDETQYRLTVCHSMAQAIGGEEIFPDVTIHKMRWRTEKDGQTTGIFNSLEELEDYLECMLENKNRLCGIPSATGTLVKRRLDVIQERRRARTNGIPLTFQSRINH